MHEIQKKGMSMSILCLKHEHEHEPEPEHEHELDLQSKCSRHLWSLLPSMSKGRQFTASSPNLGQAMVEKLLTQKDKQGESHKGNRQRKNGQKFGLLLLFCVGNGMEPEHIQHASSLFPAAPASNVQSDDYQRERESWFWRLEWAGAKTL